MTDNKNQVYIRGTVSTEAVISHEVYGEKFYGLTIDVKRTSGAVDKLPVTISERLMTDAIAVGREICISGQFRSCNKIMDGASKLLLSIFVLKLLDELPEDVPGNTILLKGYLCKKPSYRVTPLNREIADMMIAVNRAYGKSDYIPCIAWGRNAKFVSGFGIGSSVICSGRIQSREYVKKKKDGSEHTLVAYEVSISKICMVDEDTDAMDDYESMAPEDFLRKYL